ERFQTLKLPVQLCFAVLFKRHTMVSRSRLLPGRIRPRCSNAFTVLAFASGGRSISLSLRRRKTGLPPSESVSSWYPFSIWVRRSCSLPVSLAVGIATFFFAISHASLKEYGNRTTQRCVISCATRHRRLVAANLGERGTSRPSRFSRQTHLCPKRPVQTGRP